MLLLASYERTDENTESEGTDNNVPNAIFCHEFEYKIPRQIASF